MAGAKPGEVRVVLAIEGQTTRVAVQSLTRGRTITAGALLQLLPPLVRDLTEALERMKKREERPRKSEPL